MIKPFPQQDLTGEKRVYNYRHSQQGLTRENLCIIIDIVGHKGYQKLSLGFWQIDGEYFLRSLTLSQNMSRT